MFWKMKAFFLPPGTGGRKKKKKSMLLVVDTREQEWRVQVKARNEILKSYITDILVV